MYYEKEEDNNKTVKKNLEKRAKSDAIFRLWDRDGNLLVDYEKITEEGTKRLKK